MTTLTGRPGRLNRALLAVLGALLSAAGALVLARGLGLIGQADEPMLAETTVSGIAEQPWAGVAAVAAGIVVVLLGLRWLLVQLPTRTSTGQLAVHTDSSGGTTRLQASAVADAVVRDVETYPGVHAARADLTGSRARPWLSLTVTVDPRTDVRALDGRIHGHAAARLARALRAESVTTRLLVTTGHRGTR